MRERIHSLKQNRGFTLIELLVALAILVVAAAAFVPAFTFIAQSNQQNKVRMTASSVAASVIEEIRALPYDSIGTSGGNPAGTIPQTQSVSSGGITFTVETQITWGSSKTTMVTSAGSVNIVAYKNIRVVVKAPGIFTGSVEKVDEINSIASRESEEELVENGHIRVTVKDSDDEAIEFSISVHITSEGSTPSTDQTNTTDVNGQALFGVLDAGTYTVKVELPDDVTAGPGQTVTSGWIVQSAVEVKDWQVTDLTFYMDENSKLSTMTLKLVDSANTSQAITTSGILSLNWTSGSTTAAILTNEAFTSSDFEENELPDDFFGYLWPSGTYALSISDVLGYTDYDMELTTSSNPLLSDSTEWDGTMTPPGMAYPLTVIMASGTTSHFYSEDTQDEFNNCSSTQGAVSTSGGLLQLEYISTSTNLATSYSSITASSTGSIGNGPGKVTHSAAYSCDGNTSTYWMQGNSKPSLPQELVWDFGESKCIGSVTILPGVSGKVPKSITFLCSNDYDDWTTMPDVTLSDSTNTQGPFTISSPVSGQYFKLKINSLQSGSNQAALSEVQLWSQPGYAYEGTRISNVIPLGSFTSAPVFKILWSAATDSSTSVVVSTAITDSAVAPAESAFTTVTNSGKIPGITVGANLTGKYLWVMEKLYTNDIAKTPSLDWLHIDK